jgi:hypothetical protein
MFGPTKDEVTGGWRKVHNEELHNFYASPNIIRVVKSIKEDMGRARSTHEEVINTFKISVGKQMRRHHSGDLVSDGKIILNSSEGKRVGKCGSDSFGTG